MNTCSFSAGAVSRLLVIGLMIGGTAVGALAQQEHGQNLGQKGLPFDLAQTTHIFQMTDVGGLERVVVVDQAANDQILLIQQYLQQEAEALQGGSSVASLQGADMPGLREIRAGAAKIQISYSALPNGGEIVFATTDIDLSTAIHRWFGAQLSAHYADVASE
jgi:hypothetical protein